MLNQIILAIIQAATEFLPVSSSGHLALYSILFDKPNLFFFTMLHLASLIAVLIFTRKEIFELLTFKKPYRKLWTFLIIATIPAGLVGFFLNSIIKSAFSSLLFISIGFLFTSLILFLTKFPVKKSKLNFKNSLFIGFLQIFALFPGVSRSGMTISAGIFSGIKREKAAKFSFLLSIPLILGATILEIGEAYFSITLAISFITCLLLSLLFLNLLFIIIKKNNFWIFSIYCFTLGLITLALEFLL